MSNPWYTYPIDSAGNGYGEVLDPVCQNGSCSYLKPDTNIRVPNGTPITALGPGTVTDVHDYGASSGGLSVTVKLDNAINSLAQYESYNFLGSSNVSVGQSVSTGQTLGTAGSPYGINTAFALSADPHWGGPNFKYNAVGDPRLDPRQVLSSATGGGGILGNPSSSGGGWQGFVQNLTEHAFVFLIALVLVVVGFVIIARPAAEPTGGAFT